MEEEQSKEPEPKPKPATAGDEAQLLARPGAVVATAGKQSTTTSSEAVRKPALLGDNSSRDREPEPHRDGRADEGRSRRRRRWDSGQERHGRHERYGRQERRQEYERRGIRGERERNHERHHPRAREPPRHQYRSSNHRYNHHHPQAMQPFMPSPQRSHPPYTQPPHPPPPPPLLSPPHHYHHQQQDHSSHSRGLGQRVGPGYDQQDERRRGDRRRRHSPDSYPRDIPTRHGHNHAQDRDHTDMRHRDERTPWGEDGLVDSGSGLQQRKRPKRGYMGGADHALLEKVHRARENIREVTFEDPLSNRHVLQAVFNEGYESRTDIPFERIITATTPRAAYKRRRHEIKTAIHWGQRKLLMSEIEFLLLHGEKSDLVLYAGAAPGQHIRSLAEMFPQHKFVCVDPANFHRGLYHHPRIHLRQEMFTDDVAKEYADQSVLFVSDIRSCDPNLMSDKVVASRVDVDQEAQHRWVTIMKPVACMLKFRLPWEAGKTTYLAGEIYLPVWGPVTTTEARLIATTAVETKEYDNKEYEEQMFHFNTVTRVARYKHDARGEGIDYCYDCTAEVGILGDYVEKILHISRDDPSFLTQIAEISQRLSREMGSRTLADANSDPEERNAGIIKRQWINGRPAYLKGPQYSRDDVKKNSAVTSMMAAMGYEEGKGLGAKEQGMEEPIVPTRHGQKGLGFKDQGFRFTRSGVSFSPSTAGKAEDGKQLPDEGDDEKDNDAKGSVKDAAPQEQDDTSKGRIMFNKGGVEVIGSGQNQHNED